MNSGDFDTQFDRLTQHFHLPTDASRETIAGDWYEALKHYHIDALERGVTHLIRTATDRYWPALGALREAIQGRMAGMDRQPGKCATCHGSGWIDSQPFMSNGMIYENTVQRCPDCGTPAPVYTEHSHRRPLTSAEYQAKDEPKDYMPDGLKAKPGRELERFEMKAAMARLRQKLFGADGTP